MIHVLGPLVAAILLGQTPAARPLTGEVVDDQGKPVANAQVVLYSPPTTYGHGNSVEVRATSDAQGKFNVKLPPLKRIVVNGVHFFAYQSGMAITALAYMRPPYRLVLEKPSPHTVTIIGADGRPVVGARVALRLIHAFGKGNAEVPASLADALNTSTGPDGRATITTMAPRDQLVAARVTADAIGTQDILLIKRPGRDSEETAITIRLKPTSRFTGRIVDPDGQPVAGQRVEVFSRRRHLAGPQHSRVPAWPAAIGRRWLVPDPG